MFSRYKFKVDNGVQAIRDIKRKKKVTKHSLKGDVLDVTFKNRTRLTDGSRLSHHILELIDGSDQSIPSDEEETWEKILECQTLKPEHLIASPSLRYKLDLIDDCLGMLRKWGSQACGEVWFGKFRIDLTKKDRHLYIWGPPNTGKTTYW